MLAELLITLAVFAMVGGSLLALIMTSVYGIDLARGQTMALLDIQNIMEKIRAAPFQDILIFFPDAVIDGPVARRYQSLIGGYALRNERITVTYPNVNTDPLEIRVRVTWVGSEGANKAATLSTFKTRR